MKFLKLTIIVLLIQSYAQAAFWESSAVKAKREFLEFQVDQFAAGISNTKYGPNNVPDAKCIYKTKPLDIPNSTFRLVEFEIATSQVGNANRPPSISGILHMRDGYMTKKKTILVFALDIKEQFWRVDRFGIPKGMEEVTANQEVDFGDVKYYVGMRRLVQDIQKAEVKADLILYTKDQKPKAVLHARCTYKKETK